MLGFFLRILIAALQALPLRAVARLGRLGGGLAWYLDAKHRRITLENLRRAFRETASEAQVTEWAREHFRRLGENYACAVKTASMRDDQLQPHLTVIAPHNITPSPGKVAVVAIGHFGNFELFARVSRHTGGRQLATTYRALRSPAADAVLQSLRAKSGTLLFERTRDGAKLLSVLAKGDVLLGLLADQHAGSNGLWIPFFGIPCSTTAAPAVYALRHDVPVGFGACYRTGLAQWRIEFEDPIPHRRPDGTPRSTEDLMTEVNARLERAIRRDPPNWFWVHRRWKNPSPRQRARPSAATAS